MRVGIEIKGIVQGVGFRPTAYRYALANNLRGFIRNSSRGVHIEIQGEQKAINSFIKQLKTNPPIASKMDSFVIDHMDDENSEAEFTISHSETLNTSKSAGISPDLATCTQCLNEIMDPSNRRFSYAFANCTNCGPRFTIIRDRPYDRKFTSMSPFPLCSACLAEFQNPRNRRFHAQPNACSNCSPELKLILSDKSLYDGGNLIVKTAEQLQMGKIAAIKGLGGFHFACNPQHSAALGNLRNFKNRPTQAFALMMKNIGEIQKYCIVSESEKKALLSPSAPIVLLRKCNDDLNRVSPDNNYLGVMLPYTPLHHLLMKEIPLLVMTSANKRDEPLAINDEEIEHFLDEKFIDCCLTHNREIIHRCDDSIVQFHIDQQVFIRRSRGFVPQPLTVESKTEKAVLSLGANQKNTFSLSIGNSVYLSQHIGDLTDFRNYQYQSGQIDDLKKLLNIEPQEIRCDSHPAYENYREEALQIYHHHAHMLSVMAEHNLHGNNTIGVICDGTGCGTDEAVWGFEFIQTSDNNSQFQRLAHLDYFPLPGGEKAIEEIDRIAIALVDNKRKLPFSSERVEQIDALIEKGINTPQTSSLGRLFDGIASLTGIAKTADYEARGAIMLQREAERLTIDTEERYTVQLIKEDTEIRIAYKNLIESILIDMDHSKEPSLIAWKFHKWVAESIIEVLKELPFKQVVLSGGCFQNLLLLQLVTALLEEKTYDYYINTLVPPNDGGIAFGQAYY